MDHFELGRQAFKERIQIDNNPNIPHSDAFMAWEDGWKYESNQEDKFMDDAEREMEI